MVKSMQQALRIQRPQEGTWTPSPNFNRLSSPGSSCCDWASPAPRYPTRERNGQEFEFDLVVDETAAPSPLSEQLDSDGARQREQPRQRSKFEVEQLIASPGSLPKPMSADQREAAIRSLLPTATFQMMAKIPNELLSAPTSEAQQLRRTLARGATVVFVSAGLPGKRFVFEIAAKLGIKSVILEHPDSWSRSLVDEGIVAEFIPVDMSQSSEDVFQQSLELISRLGQDGRTGKADAIATVVELSVPLVARLSEALGLPGHRPQAVDNARNKHATRAALKKAGLPTPRNSLITHRSEVSAAGNHVGYPAVLKPVSGAASLGVRKVENAEELQKCFDEVTSELKNLVVTSGALVKNDGSGNGVDADSMVDLTVLLEQFLDGTEVDVDVVMSEGDWRYAAITDNGPTLEPYFNETWAVCPSLLPKEKQRELKDLAVKCVEALGFTAGVFHVECKYTSTGPQLIEVNARMGGGQVHECNLRTWGVDLVEETLFAAMGIPARPAVPKLPLSAVAYCYVNAKKSGIMGDLGFLEELRSRDNVVWAKALCRPGSKVVGPDEGLPSWLCDLLVTAPTAKEALSFLNQLEADLPVEIA